LSTYLIEGSRGSGEVGINGAAAQLIHPGESGHPDRLRDVRHHGGHSFEPSVVFVDEHNAITRIGSDPAEALPGTGTLRGDQLHTLG
jgi:aspartate 1-decarboxylase